MQRFIDRFLKDEGGATAIEYGIICALLFVAIVSAIGIVSGKFGGMFENVGDVIAGAAIS